MPKYLTIILLFTLIWEASGQGCSDAGFCTLNSFKPDNPEAAAEARNQFKIGASYGAADHSISVFGSYLEYNRIINEEFEIDAKFTTLMQSGNDISEFGLSDIYLNANYNAGKSVKFTLGAKIPLTDGNRMADGLSLPMDYQSSLGTLDLIAGIGYNIKNLQFIAALQQPLTQNKNEFLSEDYPPASVLSTFQSTNNYLRKGDVLLRVSYPIKLGSKLTTTLSLLPIYHLANDNYTDSSGIEMEIEGSQGLTLNGNLYLDYEINPTSALQLNMGIPFIVRDARPDGLTRSFVVNLEYRFAF